MAQEKLHQMLEQALEDLRNFAEAGNRVDMTIWLTTTRSEESADTDKPGICYGCLGGAYLYARNQLTPEKVTQIASQGIDLVDCILSGEPPPVFMSCLDYLRAGYVSCALAYFYHEPVKSEIYDKVPSRLVPPYSRGPARWRKAMEGILKELKEHDL